MIVGVSFIISVVFVTLVDDFLLGNFVVPGDTAALVRDIETNGSVLRIAILGYLVVLVFDAIIGLALYIVLKPANKILAGLTSVMRLLYVFTLVLALLALAVEIIDIYGYALIKRLGYIFFAIHILILGYSVFKSTYIPKSLGVLLILAAFTYIVFFVDLHLTELLKGIIMLTMLAAELALSIWLIKNRNKLPE